LISNFTQVIIGAAAVRQLLPLLVRQSASAGCAAATGRAAAEAAKAEGKKKEEKEESEDDIGFSLFRCVQSK
jgi:ribosomal protein L12E/L44/L45/RPP1/RPP2